MNTITDIKTTYDNMIYVEVNMTNSCNQKCYYCCFRHFHEKKIIKLDELSKFLIELYKLYNKDIVVELIGGEPTVINNDLIYQFSCKLNIFYPHILILLFSNFSAPIDLYIKLLESHWILFLAWHSLLNDRYNFEFIRKSKLLKTSCYIYVMYENRYIQLSLNAYKELNNGIHYVSLCELIYDKNSKQIRDLDDYYTNELLNTFYCIKNNEKNNICNLKNNHVIVIDNQQEKYILADDIKNRNFKYYQCSAGKTYLYIDQDGNIYPCRNYIDKCIGNIKYNINNIFFKSTLCKFNSCPTIVKTSKHKIFNNSLNL